MKKTIPFVIIASVFLLAGCSQPDPTLSQANPVTKQVQIASAGTYKTGSEIAESNGSVNIYKYYFAGFIGQDTFSINVDYNTGSNTGYSEPYYYPLTSGLIFNLPGFSTSLKLISYDIKNDTIKFEQLQ